MDKEYLKLILNIGVAINKLCDFIDILNDSLCSKISWSCLCTKDEGCRIKILDPAFLDSKVNIHDGEGIQKLSLIFMKSLTHNVKDEACIKIDSLHLLYIVSKVLLLFFLNLIKFLNYLLIISKLFKLFKLIKICCKAASDLILNEA